MFRLVPHPSSSFAGPYWILVSSLCFAAAWTFIKLAGQDVHPFAVVFWRCLIGAAMLGPFIASGRIVLPLAKIRSHAVRAASGVVAMFATFYALANAPLATVQAIVFAAPIFATVGAVMFLGEIVRARRVAALAVGFLGVLIVLRPGATPLTLGIAAAILSALAIAFSTIAIKRLVGLDAPIVVVAWSFILPIPVALAVSLPVWSWPSEAGWLWLLLVGATTLPGQMAMARAFSLADATAIMPYDFVRLGLVAAIGALIFGEVLSAWTLTGGAVILASSIYLAYREAQLARAPIQSGSPPLAPGTPSFPAKSTRRHEP